MSTLSRRLTALAALVAPAVVQPHIVRATHADMERLRSDRAHYTRDEFTTFDRATMDSAGAFLVGELERLDPMVHEPLVSVTWWRDIDLRTDVTMGDTSSSYTLLSFAAPGGTRPAGKNWASPNNTAIPRVAVDIGKEINPLTLWNQEVAYTLPELESAQRLNRPIDAQQLQALNLKHQMDTDEQVYIGDTDLGVKGLLNSAAVSNVANVVNGAASSPLWVNKTPEEILTDINELLVSVWAASGYTSPPTKLLLPPVQMGYIATQTVSTAATETILSFVKTRNILTAEKGLNLEISSVKWAATAGVSANTRMAAYTQRPDYVRFPMVPLRAASVQYDGIWVKTPYYGRLGVVETVYPETIGYRDGL